jgi:hypothetical protein
MQPAVEAVDGITQEDLLVVTVLETVAPGQMDRAQMQLIIVAVAVAVAQLPVEMVALVALA